MKHLVGKVITKKVPFMDDEVEVKKLTVGEIFDLQEIINASQEKTDDPKAQVHLIRDILKVAVIGADEISDDDFNNFPISELTSLSEEILAISGIAGGNPEGNSP